MNNKLILLSFLILFTNFIFAQNSTCSRVTNFGQTEICLPKIDGFVESYEDTVIKEIADATEVSSNAVLGYYVSKEVYENKDNLDQVDFNNYFKIYGTLQIKDVEVNAEMLNQMEQMVSSNFLSENWDELKKEIQKSEIGSRTEIKSPTIIKTQKLNDKSFTFILLTEYNIEDIEPYIMAMSLNGIIVNKKLIWLACYLNFKNEQTIKTLEKQNETIVNSILFNNTKS